MQSDRVDIETGPGVGYPAASVDRVIEPATPAYVAPSRLLGVAPISDVDQNVVIARNRVQWGPVFAGMVVSLTTILILSVLGLAIGASALDQNADMSDWGTAAGLWAAATILIAFFLGGLVAAKTAAVGGPGSGMINGLVSGAATLLLMIWLTTVGLTGLIGFFGSNIANLAAAAPDSVVNRVAQEVNPPAVADQAQEAVQNADEAVAATARDAADETAAGAWGTFIAMLVALTAAALGGLVGHNKRWELATGEG